jgi:hypothetical protein
VASTRCGRAKLYGDANDDKIKDTVVWTALRSIKRADPISFPKPLALVALRIKASDQLSGIINTFNCICTSLVKAWNGASWDDDAVSQIPSDLFRHALQGPANARPAPDSAIDIVNMARVVELLPHQGIPVQSGHQFGRFGL